jgi:hypothetical protein
VSIIGDAGHNTFSLSDLLQFVIVAGFGALCFGCGYLIAFIVTRNRWRDEMIRRGVARYVANGIGASRPKKGSRGIKCPPAASRRPGRLKTRVAFVVKDSSGQARLCLFRG